MTAPEWKVWSTLKPTLIDLSAPDDPPDGPEAAALAACAWNLNADGGWWFLGGVATLGIEAPTGERSTCAAWLTPDGQVQLTPMVPR